MNIYQTEIEQTEIIKKWFKQYGYWVSCSILILLLIVAGCRFWTIHTAKIKGQASERYQQLMVAVANDDDALVTAQVNDLTAHYSKTIYAEVATMTQAKLFVSERKLTKALSELNKVIQQGKNSVLRQIARLRSARILCALKDYKKALSLLETVDDPAYSPAIDEIKGDIYAGLNNKKQARAHYEAAIKAFSKKNLISPFLEMKLNRIQ